MTTHLALRSEEEYGAADGRPFFNVEDPEINMFDLSQEVRQNYGALMPLSAIDISRTLSGEDGQELHAVVSTGFVKGEPNMWSWTLAYYEEGTRAELLVCDVGSDPAQEGHTWQHIRSDNQGVLRRQSFVEDDGRLVRFVSAALTAANLQPQAEEMTPKLEAAKKLSQEQKRSFLDYQVIRWKAIGFIGIGLKDSRLATPSPNERTISAENLPELIQRAIRHENMSFEVKAEVPRGLDDLIAAQAEVSGST